MLQTLDTVKFVPAWQKIFGRDTFSDKSQSSTLPKESATFMSLTEILAHSL